MKGSLSFTRKEIFNMAYIVFSIIGVLSLIIVKKNWHEEKQIIFVSSTIIGSVLLYVLVDIFVFQAQGGISKGSDDILSKIPCLEIGLYFVMLMGMASKYLFDAIGEKNRKKIKFNKWQFIKPFLVSPMIFLSVYSLIPEKTSTLLLLIFSYQNGFFWQTILYKRISPQENPGK